MSDNEIKRDETMDINSLLNNEKSSDKKQSASSNKGQKVLGQIVENKDLIEANKEHKIVRKNESDAEAEVNEYLNDQDKMIEAAKKMNVQDKPKNAIEMVQLMDTVAAVASGEIEVEDSSNTENQSESLEENSVDKNATVNSDVDTEDDPETVPEIDEEKAKMVQVLIDKTGFGSNFAFNEDERNKLTEASEILVKEIEEVELSSIKVVKSQKSFMDDVKEFQMASSKVPIVFPASRFRAYMTGLSYGEMGDISLNGENITFDQMHKKLTVIYNKMINPSIGEFDSFEDFLRKFSYTDIDLAVYGLIIATFPEVDDIPLTCNNPKCKKGFNHQFSPRALIRFDKADKQFLKTMETIIDCPPTEVSNLSEESPTRKHKRYKLPYSGFVVELGIASAYDYLYTIVDNTLGNTFRSNHPDDVNGILQLNTLLLGLIRGVYVPDGNGGYREYTDFEDVIQALYYIKPEDINILTSILQKFTSVYTTTFELRDIECPHCHTKTELIPIDVNYLVFLKYQRLMNTEIDVKNITVL